LSPFVSTATQGTDSVPPPGQSTDAQLSATLRALADQTPSNSVSGEGGPASRAANSQEDIILEQLSAQLHAAFQTDPEQSTGEGDLPGMSSLVDTIMQQLLSKDVLYQPMKDIGGRYPEWIEAHRGELSPEDITKYEEQYEYIQRICTLYETNPKDYSHLMDLLNEMQQRGQPPQEIIDELAPGMTFGPDGIPQSSSLPGNDGECCVQ
jgi:peroxin-19